MRNYLLHRRLYSHTETWSLRRISACCMVIFIVCIAFFYLAAKPADVDTCPRKSHRYEFNDRRLIENMCSSDASYCYSVYDVKTEHKGSEVVFRALVHSNRSFGMESAVALHAPEGEKYDSSDTKKWPVNHHTIPGGFTPSDMLAGMFLMSSLSLNSSDYGKRVLSIGLGGGSVDMVLSSVKPEVDVTVVEIDPLVVSIASKWFGVADSNHHHTVIRNGITFIEEAAARGMKYAAVVLDACGNDEFKCPVKVFRTAYAVKMLRKILMETGTLVVNTVTTKDADTNCTEFKKLLLSTFKSCVEIHVCRMMNIVFVCTPSALPNSYLQMAAMNERLRLVEQSLKMDHYFREPTIVPPFLNCSLSNFQKHGHRKG